MCNIVSNREGPPRRGLSTVQGTSDQKHHFRVLLLIVLLPNKRHYCAGPDIWGQDISIQKSIIIEKRELREPDGSPG